ncbi:MAG: phosphoenolpyruvate--protein phosphotransferase [Geopsychrobacter sp.]|nr:phosphoenolpyruvate--protein phosphotransferase [Geopsychrobacter sp.]
MGKTEVQQDTYLVGLGVSPGVGIGRICLLNRLSHIAEWQIDESEIEGEVLRFRKALVDAGVALRGVKQKVASQPHLREHIYILDTHLLILEDELLTGRTEELIRQKNNAESALGQTLKQLRTMFENIEDEYLRERSSDLDAVGQRLQRILAGVTDSTLDEIKETALVAAHDLSPADTMQLDRDKVVGFITDRGGKTSHTAILARSLGIPAVVGLESATAIVQNEMPAIIDGTTGVVILNPSEETFREYLKRKLAFEYLEKELSSYRDLPAETRDKVKVTLRANLEIVSEVPAAQKDGAVGVGLYRTEFLYMNRTQPPSEEEQFAAYSEIAQGVAPHPVTIRTLDVGGDKFVPDVSLEQEDNPAMGLRAIRLSLREVDLFKVQLRAILRASALGNVRIMFPMISGVAEIRTCKRILRTVKSELTQEKIPFDPQLQIGIMIETPSAVMIASLLAKEVDFFSIGTNDLIQYCLAVDRGNEHVAYLYEPLHPAILTALKMVCDAAHANGVAVSMCGEMAAEPLYVPVLLGLGLDELSMNHACLPRVKRVLRNLKQTDGEAILLEIMQLSTGKEVAAYLDREMRKLLPDLFGDFVI